MSNLPSGVPLWFQLLVGVPPFALTAYWWWTYAGLYRWLGQFQLWLFGSYFTGLTFIFTMIGLVAPWAVILGVVCDPWLKDRVDPYATQADTERFHNWLGGLQHKFAVIGLVFGIGVAVIGGALLDSSAEPWATMTVAELERGTPAASNQLILQKGRLLTEHGHTWKINSVTTTFVPLVSPQWRPGMPVSVIVNLRESELAEHRGDVPGWVNLFGLRGDVRTSLEQSGVLLHPEPVVIEYKVHRGGNNALPITAIVFGVATVGFICLVWLMQVRRARMSQSSLAGDAP